jgi:polysaccharide export outer membrane protein
MNSFCLRPLASRQPSTATAVLLAALGLLGPAASVDAHQVPPTPRQPATAVPAPPHYIVGAQDVLNITLWEQPDLSGKFTVESDGTFTYPLIGRITAGGRTLRDIEAELKKQLENGFFRNPQLSVSVDQYRSQRIHVVGEVRQPGTYPLTGNMTLIEALARAGSTSERASREAVIVRSASGAAGPVLPDQAGGAETITVDLKELQSGRPVQHVALRDGDTVFVKPAEPVYVTGHVRNPGAYAIAQEMTVLQALSLAGGVTDRGATGRITLIRIVNGKRTESKVKLTDLVRSGDTLLVPERFF